ncbi:acyl-CoA synthetase (AMP-forming)/AMP-acid ligase II [Halopolyspora algeriensis]|uniref:Acyl-CoA synthetase (AMP-forming)/AMP-acid ligase II n=1 Tax=Halopolyspora algeriensis TaxID=1500506 RepID=A0A368VPF3_9ACTN|nr:AMP-binding protein [Halopolyspora algeriensis]RCW41020.1 acyl-CoA synthetase (AMP-forming)/AMP-acid ligase II [Halopolyspora algeriensis]TQM53896.1 acyl-CoA synthetase (AMP-forming)/AMP-acid ligase II [Halopolyspora algeriensis]
MSFDYLPWNAPADAQGHVAVRDARVELTYAELDDWTRAVAGQLAGHGFGAGDVVAIMLPNRVELLVTLLAAWRLGAAATPVNPAFTEQEATYQIHDSGAKLVVNLDADAPSGGCPSIAVDDLVRNGEGPDPVAVVGDELSLLIYTSGSTGRPKGVMLDHANAEAMSSTMAAHFGLTSDDHCLLVLPLFHVNAIMVSALSIWRSGGQLSVVGQFSAGQFFDHVEKLRPTYFSAVPTIYALLASLPEDVRPDTSSLRFTVCGAAPASEELLHRCQERFGFVMVEGYGLTEGTCASACNPIDGVRKPGTVGPALPGQTIGVMSESGELLPAGQRGEVVVAGPTVMRGYLNRPDTTAETIRDGWLHTGDVGVLDEDGYLRIVDRVKDMIIRGGENLYPKEIETVLTSLEGVLEATVVGRPDPVFGEVPVAYVSLYPDSSLTADDVLEHCRLQLMRAKVPEHIEILEDLPKNSVGKVDKPALRSRLQHI